MNERERESECVSELFSWNCSTGVVLSVVNMSNILIIITIGMCMVYTCTVSPAVIIMFTF